MPSPERHQTNQETPSNRPEAGSQAQGRDRDKNRESVEALAERLRLKEQYLAQIKVLYRCGLLENFPATSEHPLPESGVTGVDGQQHYLPDFKEILSRLSSNPEKTELLAKKAEQGFTKLLLVPFALPIETIIKQYKKTLISISQEPQGVKSTDGSRLEVDTDNPLYVWEDLLKSDRPATSPDRQLEYQVKNYEGKTKEQRGGQYKYELLKDPANSWQILLVEDRPDLPAKGQGETISGRHQIEADKSAKEYLHLLQTDPQYQGEQGLTPESQLILALTRLQETKTAINDWQGSGKANRLAGTYLAGVVLNFYWHRDGRRAYLFRRDPDDRGSSLGFSPAVSV